MDYTAILIAIIIALIVVLLGWSKKLLFPICCVGQAITGVDVVSLHAVAATTVECFSS